MTLRGADRERRQRAWQLQKLAPIAPHLQGDWRRRYEDLVAEYGAPEYPQPPFRVRSWTGPTSPKSADEIAALTVEEVVGFLREWRPAGEWDTPSPEGLGRQLSEAVKLEPERFAEEAHLFVDLERTYVRGLLWGLSEVAKEKRPLDWTRVLDVAAWAVAQTHNASEPIASDDQDPDWNWTRGVIAELMGQGFHDGPAEIPFQHRDAVWEVLEPLTRDPQPTPEYEAEYGGSNMDPATLSINTTRGKAMHSVVLYALWVHRHQGDSANGFEDSPEAATVLDGHLDPSVDPAVTIRAVYGQRLPVLVRIDPGWVRDRLSLIFPDASDEVHLRDAAWETYVTFCGPDKLSFPVLRSQYAEALGRLGSPRYYDQRALGQSDRALARHLMVLYWWGELDFGQADRLLERFFESASAATRGEAIGSVGHFLKSFEGDLPDDVQRRLKVLWERRFAAAKTSTAPGEHREELVPFGWWFASGRLGDSWALKQAQDVLDLVGDIEHDHMVAEALTRTVQTMPLESVRCARSMIEADREGWHLVGWRDDARAILAAALGGDNANAQREARDLVNRLGARGYQEFRDLLG